MVKKIAVLLLLFIFLAVSFAFAGTYVTDDAGIFTNDEIIESQLQELQETLSYPNYIVTTRNIGEQSLEMYAATQLENRIGTTNKGTLLLIDMGSRSLYFTTSTATELSDNEINTVADEVQSYLAVGDNNGAGERFPKILRKLKGPNYISFLDTAIAFGSAAIASLLLVFGIGGNYTTKFKPFRFQYQNNALMQFAITDDKLLDTKRSIIPIPIVKPRTPFSGGGGGVTTTRTPSGGSFRGTGRKF